MICDDRITVVNKNLLEAVSEKKEEEKEEEIHLTEDNCYFHPIRLTVYLFGMTNKEIEVISLALSFK